MLFLNVFKWKQGSQINQCIATFLVTFPALLCGLLSGWISPALPKMQAPDGPLQNQLSSGDIGWMASCQFITGFPAMLASGWLANAIGRKNCVIFACACLNVCWLIKIIWMNSKAIIIARSIAGFGGGIVYALSSVYVKEISDDNIRGALCSTLILAQNIGYIIMFILGDVLSFKAVLLFSLALCIIHLIVFVILVPETPSYLVQQGKSKEATEVLAWLRSMKSDDKSIVDEIKKLEQDIHDAEKINKTTLTTIVKDKTVRKAVMICTVVMVCQEMSGVLVLVTYASEILTSTGLVWDITPNQQTIILGSLQLTGSVFASTLVERTGRKPLLITTSFLTGLGLSVLGAWFYCKTLGIVWSSYVPICAMCVSVFCTAAGFQPIAYVILAEMFSYQLRGLVSSLIVSLTCIIDFGQTEAYGPMKEGIGLHGTFWTYALVCFIGTLVTVIFVPETKNNSLEDIYQALNGMPNETTEQNNVSEDRRSIETVSASCQNSTATLTS